jgi:hypothetical protein
VIIENEDEVKRIKQIIGVIQACTLPIMKGIDAFSLHNNCEWVFNQCLVYENIKNTKDVQGVEQVQREEEKSKEVTKKRTYKKRGKK